MHNIDLSRDELMRGAVNINEFPSNVLLRISDFLIRCESVCKTRRSEFRDTRKIAELWKTICFQNGTVPEHFWRMDN